jgi:hypothetical protein
VGGAGGSGWWVGLVGRAGGSGSIRRDALRVDVGPEPRVSP